MDRNSNLSNSFKKATINSMLTYLRQLSVENLENVIVWAKSSQKPDANINTTSPNEWEKNMKLIFSQLSLHEQSEIMSQANYILNEKKDIETKLN